ncbi:hypothetical protein ABC304_07000 [Microbacterium sp. 1P10UB]|uniref:hypothetical protein n=1 Tax=unclassified Microbacterium TaxID=2609290 RepID=UPI00399FDD2A
MRAADQGRSEPARREHHRHDVRRLEHMGILQQERGRAPNDLRDREQTPTPHPRERAAAEHVALAEAYATAMPPDTVFSHQTAALILGLPVPVPTLLDVSAIAPRRASRATGVRGRQLDPALIGTRSVSGLIVCDPATTWAQLGGLVGASLSLDDLVIVGDAIIRVPRLRSGHAGEPQHALARIENLRAAATVGRRAGAAALRAALELIRLGSSSPGETRARLAVVRAGLPEPELDVEILGESGELIGIADLAYRLRRVMVEYEGDQHRVDIRQWNRDIEKYAACESLGWIVVRVTSEHLRSGAAVARIRAALTRRGWAAASPDE